MTRLGDWFNQFAKATARWCGHPVTFAASLALCVVWAATGPVFHYSDTWQLVINTATTVLTFLVVFLIQNTQNRDAAAMHLKLDELIRAVAGARNRLVDLEDVTEEELTALQARFAALGAKARSGGDEDAQQERDRKQTGDESKQAEE
jgi:low affinity Fe/Cu permease